MVGFCSKNNCTISSKNKKNECIKQKIIIKMRYMYKENMYKVMAFCHLQENLEINMVNKQWILRQKQE